MPHVFVFDQARTLRYEGLIDDGKQGGSADARKAIDALLAGKAVATERTRVEGCPVKALPTTAATQAAADGNAAVTVEMAGADELKKLRQNGTGKLLLINFWATWCAPLRQRVPGSRSDLADVQTSRPRVRRGVGQRPEESQASSSS